MRVAAVLLIALATAAAAFADDGSPATRRAGLVDVHRYAPGIRVDLAYLTPHNFTGRRLPGYCENWGLLNRLMLKTAMERFGFSAYLNEWWHFEHYIRPDRYLDLTLGC